MANNKLVLELVADSNNLLKAMEQSQKSINNFVRAADAAGVQLGGLNRVMNAFTQLAQGGSTAALVVAAAVTAAELSSVGMAIAAGKASEQLSQLSEVTGIGTDKLQDYGVMLNRAGLTGDDLVQVMKHVSTSLDQARQGTGSAADRFRQLGIDIRTVTSTDDLIRKIAGSSAQFANGAEKAAIMSDLMGKGWATFIKAFGGGTKAMDDATAASERLGATLSGGQIAELAAMDDRVDDLTTAWKRFSQQLGSFVAPAVDFAATALANLLSMASNALKELNALGGVSAAQDTRAKPPPFVDQAKVLERARAAADAQLKVMESQFKQEAALGQARLQNLEAQQSAEAGLDLAADVKMAQNREAALARVADFTQASFKTEIENFRQHYAEKAALYGSDEKSQDALAKFSIENAGKVAELMSQAAIAQLNSDSAKVTSARKTADLMKQLQLQPYQDAVAAAKTLDDAQRTLYQSEAGMLGASDAARRVRMNLIMEEAALKRVEIEQTIADETRKAQAIQNLELETDTKRRQAIQQFPSFFEQQLQAVVSSNAFSMASMVSTWSGGIAQMIVHGGNLQAVWEQTQVALVQAALNAGVQQVAQAALAAAQELGIMTAKTESEVAMNVAKDATIVASDTAAAATTVGIWGAAGVAISGFFAATLAGFEAMVGTMVATLTAVGTFVMGVLSAIAAALTETIFGIPWAGAILVGIALIAAALAATGNLGFKDGGIGDFGSGTPATLHGQEAIIPLNDRGAAFMQDAFGGGGGSQTIIVQMDGREMARRTMQYMPGIFTMKTGLS